ncbi:MAG: FHA domain-containing protein [Clostridiaceae bacterium]|nr:FHA domain-containing protein [Clostridiaceae bacterium]
MHPNACFWESGLYSRLLIRSISDEEQLVEYQIQLLTRFKPEYTLPSYLRYRSGKPQICVDATDMRPLDESMLAEDLCPETGRRYLSQIITDLIDANEHLLPTEQFVLQPSLIFLNNDKTLFLVFWPIQQIPRNQTQECSPIPDNGISSMISSFSRSFHFSEAESIKLQEVYQSSGLDKLLKTLQIADEQLKGDNTGLSSSHDNKWIKHKWSAKIQRSPVLLFLCHAAFAGLFIYYHLGGFQRSLWMQIICLSTIVLLLVWDVRLIFPNIIHTIIKNISSVSWRQFIDLLCRKSTESGNPENQTVLLTDNPEDFRMAMLSEGKPGTPEENEGIRAFILIDEFIIGRDEKKADLILPDPGIGRLHARIFRRAGSFFIYDLGSKNGTCLNGRRLLKDKEYLLPDQCLLQFANHAFYFQAD